jgi:hypothetical protein
MTEALGGWFAFGAADRIRYTMEKFLERMRSTMPADIVTSGSETSALRLDRSSPPGDNDVATLSEILLAHRLSSNISSLTARGRWSRATRSSNMWRIWRATRARYSSACASPRLGPWSGCRRRSRK